MPSAESCDDRSVPWFCWPEKSPPAGTPPGAFIVRRVSMTDARWTGLSLRGVKLLTLAHLPLEKARRTVAEHNTALGVEGSL